MSFPPGGVRAKAARLSSVVCRLEGVRPSRCLVRPGAASDCGLCPRPQVTDHATTALLHYQLPQMPDVVVRSFMVSGPGLRPRVTLGGWAPRPQAARASQRETGHPEPGLPSPGPGPGRSPSGFTPQCPPVPEHLPPSTVSSTDFVSRRLLSARPCAGRSAGGSDRDRSCRSPRQVIFRLSEWELRAQTTPEQLLGCAGGGSCRLS